MGERLLRQISRFILLILLQVLVFKRLQVEIGSIDYFKVMIYPLMIILMPLTIQKGILLLVAFVMGLVIDGFYDSPGVHAAALVATAYLRSIVLRIVEPYEGYNTDLSPTLKSMGFSWFLTYMSLMMLVHLFLYFSIEAFTFYYIFDIVLSTIFSLIVSVLIILLYQFIFRSKY